MSEFLNMFSYHFMQRALVVGVLVYHEILTASSLAGCVLILTSVVIVARMKE